MNASKQRRPNLIIHHSSFIIFQSPIPNHQSLSMPDLRKDPIVGRWVIIATARAKRPHDFDSTPQRQKGRYCPFCEGHEDKTPDEIIAYRRPARSATARAGGCGSCPTNFPPWKSKAT